MSRWTLKQRWYGREEWMTRRIISAILVLTIDLEDRRADGRVKIGIHELVQHAVSANRTARGAVEAPVGHRGAKSSRIGVNSPV